MSKFGKLSEYPTWKREASTQRFSCKLKQKKTFLTKMNMRNCILRVLLLLPSMVLLKCTNFPLVLFLNFVQETSVSSIGTFNYNLAHFLCNLLWPLATKDYSCKDTFSFLSLIKNANLSRKCIVSYNLPSLFTNISLQETVDIAINLIFNYNYNLNIMKKELKKLFLFATPQTDFP